MFKMITKEVKMLKRNKDVQITKILSRSFVESISITLVRRDTIAYNRCICIQILDAIALLFLVNLLLLVHCHRRC